MKTTSIAGVVLVLAAVSGIPSPASAEESARDSIEEGKQPEFDSGFHATVTFATDYVFRGVSQTDDGPAVQGCLDYVHTTGFYAGIWGSNVDDVISTGGVEFDFYAGYAKRSGRLGYDLSLVYYAYPGDEGSRPRADYVEGTGAVSYAFEDTALSPTLGVAYFYSPEYFAESGPGHYGSASFDLSLPLQFGLGFEFGYQGVFDGDVTEGLSWTHWRVSATKQIAGFELELNYQDTSGLDGLAAVADIADARIVFLISRSF